MKLKSLLAPVLGVALASTAFAGSSAKTTVVDPVAPPADDLLGFSVSLGYDSDYVFRGVKFGENLVSGAVEGSIPLTEGVGLDLGAWFGTLADDSFLDGLSYHELNLSAALTFDLGPVSLGAKYQYYYYDGDAGALLDDVHEFGIVAATNIGGVTIEGGAYYDETADGFYFEVGPVHTFQINDKIGVEVGAQVSYAVDYYGIDGFNHVKAWVALPISLTRTATLKPYIAGNLPIDALDDTGEKDRVYGGVSLEVKF